MNFLKSLFGGGSGGDGDSRGLYLYVKPHRCDDVIRVRVDLSNDLSLDEDGSGYVVRKMASSANYKCTQVELNLHFDNGRRLREKEIQGGQFVEREDYVRWQEQQQHAQP